jgi:drug/metabolite transporter (DMT)-like permease
MAGKLFRSSNRTAVYIIAFLIIIVFVLLLGGLDWFKGLQLNQSLGLGNLNWTQIIIAMLIGFGLGWLVFIKR